MPFLILPPFVCISQSAVEHRNSRLFKYRSFASIGHVDMMCSVPLSLRIVYRVSIIIIIIIITSSTLVAVICLLGSCVTGQIEILTNSLGHEQQREREREREQLADTCKIIGFSVSINFGSAENILLMFLKYLFYLYAGKEIERFSLRKLVIQGCDSRDLGRGSEFNYFFFFFFGPRIGISDKRDPWY
jgi:hypothetical protein